MQKWCANAEMMCECTPRSEDYFATIAIWTSKELNNTSMTFETGQNWVLRLE
jgi:hypothetical protein